MAEEGTVPKWEDMFGEVVWAKVGSFPWWPCYIYDPNEVPADKEVIEKAARFRNQQHCIYYYGDKTFGFAAPKSIKPYDETNRASFLKQKISKSYAASFALAVEQADVDVLLPKKNRVAWHIPVDPEEIKVEKKLKIKRPASDEGGEDSGERDLFDSMESAALYFHEDELEEDEAEEDEAVSEEESDVASQDSEPVMLARKRKPKAAGDTSGKPEKDTSKPKKRRLVKSSAATDSTQKQAKSLLSTKKNTPSKARLAEPVTPVVDFGQESRMDRLKRLMGILGVCVEMKTLDEARAVKTIEKINGMNLTFPELRESGVALVINELRKHMSTKISELARRVRQEWKDKLKPEGTSSGTPAKESTSGEDAALIPPAPTAEESPRSRNNNKSTTAGPVVPTEVSTNQVRSNAVRLLQHALTSLPAAVRCEAVIERLYGEEKAKYFECVSRCVVQLQKSEGVALKDLLSRSSSLVVSSDGSSEVSRWIQQSFQLVSSSAILN